MEPRHAGDPFQRRYGPPFALFFQSFRMEPWMTACQLRKSRLPCSVDETFPAITALGCLLNTATHRLGELELHRAIMTQQGGCALSFLVHATPQTAFVRAYNSMWIADCVCANAVRLNRFQPAFECDYCGAFYELIWPAESMVYSVERLLLMRPLPYTRNWFPGETVQDLMRENSEHGVFSDPRLTQGYDPATVLLCVDDEGIRKDMLPVTVQREFKAVEA